MYDTLHLKSSFVHRKNKEECFVYESAAHIYLQNRVES